MLATNQRLYSTLLPPLSNKAMGGTGHLKHQLSVLGGGALPKYGMGHNPLNASVRTNGLPNYIKESLSDKGRRGSQNIINSK